MSLLLQHAADGAPLDRVRNRLMMNGLIFGFVQNVRELTRMAYGLRDRIVMGNKNLLFRESKIRSFRVRCLMMGLHLLRAGCRSPAQIADIGYGVFVPGFLYDDLLVRHRDLFDPGLLFEDFLIVRFLVDDGLGDPLVLVGRRRR